MKTKNEIIKETLDRIAKRGRSVNENGMCAYYNGKDGNMCAVGGACLHPRLLQENCGSLSLRSVLVSKEMQSLDPLLKPEYRGHDVAFWEDLQAFHDTDENWSDPYTLTHEGVRVLEEEFGFAYEA